MNFSIISSSISNQGYDNHSLGETVLKDVSFTAKQGEVTGGGKTTVSGSKILGQGKDYRGIWIYPELKALVFHRISGCYTV